MGNEPNFPRGKFSTSKFFLGKLVDRLKFHRGKKLYMLQKKL